MRFGMHLSTSRGLSRLPDHAADLGARTYQIFVDNPSSWRYSDFDEEQVELFLERRRALDQGPLVVHTGYLINLSSDNETTAKRSRVALVREFALSARLEAEYLVLHPGKHMGRGREKGLELIVEGLLAVFDDLPPGVEYPLLLLENSEGSGTCLGVDFSELAALLEALKNGGRTAGVCLDTAHLWGAGYDLSSRESTRRVIDDFSDKIGVERLHCLHLNDSIKELGSRTDRHAFLGTGRIGLEAFRELVNDERLERCAMILEKPGETPEQSRQLIAELVGLRE